jgi:hypothetical protein
MILSTHALLLYTAGILGIIQDAIKQFLSSIKPLESFESIPSVLTSTGLALLTILIPLAIAILQEVFRKKRSKEEEFAELDLQTILDTVFRVKRLLIFIMLTFVPFIFWDMTKGIALFRLLEIIVSLTGISYMTKIVLNFYGWTKGNVLEFRLNHLRKLKSVPEINNAWASVWKSKMDTQTEMKFFNILSSTIEQTVTKHEKGH